MGLEDEVAAALEAARAFAEDGEEVTGIVPAEPAGGLRVYLCAYEGAGERRWLALDADGRAVTDRALVREAVSIAALCELAEECAGGGDVAGLRARLAELEASERPEGIGEAIAAAEALAGTIAPAPRVASAAYLDAVGLAAARLELALGGVAGSPFAEAVKVAAPAADELARDVERSYKATLA